MLITSALIAERFMLVPHNTLVLAADGGHYSLYRNTGGGVSVELTLLAEASLTNFKTSELGTDSPGRTFQSTGKRRASYEQADLHSAEEEAFAAAAAGQLGDYAAGSECSIVMIADPRTLGRLRAHLSDSLRARILDEINRDYALRRPEDIVQLLSRLRQK
jgi:protein required for attachment to host cells